MKTKLLIIFLSLTATLWAKEGAIQCGNLIYAGTKTSHCFSDEFLSMVQQKTSVSTERRFKPVKLASDELFKFPFVIMTGEGDFTLTQKERDNLKKYLENGGFLLASASCSNEAWASAYEREIKRIFGKEEIKNIKMDHSMFKTIYKIKELKSYKTSTEINLKGLNKNGKLVMVYSSQGLNDTAHTDGCCCCGGSEINDSAKINANILAYSLLH